MNEQEPIPLDPAPAVENPLFAELDKAQRQIADYKSIIADFENARKRLTADAAKERKYAAEGVARDILPAIDNLDRAVAAAKQAGESGPLAQGVSATAGLILEALKRHGVTKIDVEPGSAFDPHAHQAVAQQPHAEIAPGAVIQVLQPGFRFHDRILRPASVVVAAD
jgi:molecular chaperone GrpE